MPEAVARVKIEFEIDTQAKALVLAHALELGRAKLDAVGIGPFPFGAQLAAAHRVANGEHPTEADTDPVASAPSRETHDDLPDYLTNAEFGAALPKPKSERTVERWRANGWVLFDEHGIPKSELLHAPRRPPRPRKGN